MAEKYSFSSDTDRGGRKAENKSPAYIVADDLDKLNVFHSLQILYMMNKICTAGKGKRKKAITDGQNFKTGKMTCPEKVQKIQGDPEATTSPRELGFALPLGYNSLDKEESVSSCQSSLRREQGWNLALSGHCPDPVPRTVFRGRVWPQYA